MIKVIVPATTANIGTGFDTFGIALQLYNTFYIKASSIKVNHDPLIEETIAKYESVMSKKMPKFSLPLIEVTVDNDVPISRGLGSSATCIIGVLWGLNAFMDNLLNDEELLYMAVEIEGHPDNIVPCLKGGFKSSIMVKEKCHIVNHPISESLEFVALIPNFKLSTKESREVLPSKIEFKDTVHNISRIPFLLEGFKNGNTELIKIGSDDKIHQPYRISLIENGKEIIKLIEKLFNLPVFISGAGPTLMVVANKSSHVYNELESTIINKFPKWQLKKLLPHNGGIRIERME